MTPLPQPLGRGTIPYPSAFSVCISPCALQVIHHITNSDGEDALSLLTKVMQDVVVITHCNNSFHSPLPTPGL